MTLIELARKLRPYIEKAAASLSDEDALEAIQLFPVWDKDKVYIKGDRALYDGVLYSCLQAHHAQANWTPTSSPSLWAKVLIPDPNVIPEWEQPDSTNPYMKGDRVMYDGKVYESTIDNNVWSPAIYPGGWTEVNI
jgi:chitodextrinase